MSVPDKPEIWHLSYDGHHFNLYDQYPCREAAIQGGIDLYKDVAFGRHATNDLYQDELAWTKDPTFYIGKQIDWWPTVDEDDIIERMQMEADDFAGEYSDGWLDVTDKYDRDLLREMLQSAFDEWMKKTHNEPWFFMVEQTELINPRKPCRNADEETAMSADAEILAIAGQERKSSVFELGA